MNYGRIIERDSTNGPGIRVTLFVSGCTHHCKGCFQPETWNFDYGEKFTSEIEDNIIDLLKPNYVSGLTILGGDPFEKSNQFELYPFIKKLREVYSNSKTIWAFTGAIYESLLDKEYENDEEKRMEKAFRNLADDENDIELFESYVRGGIEILYEKCISDSTQKDDFMDNIINFLEELKIKYPKEYSL